MRIFSFQVHWQLLSRLQIAIPRTEQKSSPFELFSLMSSECNSKASSTIDIFMCLCGLVEMRHSIIMSLVLKFLLNWTRTSNSNGYCKVSMSFFRHIWIIWVLFIRSIIIRYCLGIPQMNTQYAKSRILFSMFKTI